MMFLASYKVTTKCFCCFDLDDVRVVTASLGAIFSHTNRRLVVPSLSTIAAPAYHPPPALPPLPFPLEQLTEPLSRSLVIFLTLASCLATVSHAIDTNYTRPDPCNGALFTAPGVMYQYPANCCQAPLWPLLTQCHVHVSLCQVSADNTNQNKWLHHMSSPLKIQFSAEVDDI